MALAGATLELTAAKVMESRLGMLAEPYETGKSGTLTKTARALTLAGAALSVVGRRSRLLRAVAGLSYLAGSATTRFGIFEAGLASARDPKYTVIPQRERLRARQAADHAPSEEPVAAG
jgi:hypothetical protein